MSDRPAESYVVLAVVIAGSAIVASTFQTVDVIRDFDPTGSTLLTFVGGALAQCSSALAMVCAILIARAWLTDRPPAPFAHDHPPAVVGEPTSEPAD